MFLRRWCPFNYKW